MGQRKFDREFKINAVKLALEGNRTIRQVAEDSGVGFSTLGSWIHEYKKDP